MFQSAIPPVALTITGAEHASIPTTDEADPYPPRAWEPAHPKRAAARPALSTLRSRALRCPAKAPRQLWAVDPLVTRRGGTYGIHRPRGGPRLEAADDAIDGPAARG